MSNLSLASLSNELADLAAAGAASVVQVLGARRPASGVVHGTTRSSPPLAQSGAKMGCVSESVTPTLLKPNSPGGIPQRASPCFARAVRWGCLHHRSPRESQVLGLVADGLPNKAIAAALGVSDETVKFHLGSIFGKLGASNRTDAVRLAFRRGLVPL